MSYRLSMFALQHTCEPTSRRFHRGYRLSMFALQRGASDFTNLDMNGLPLEHVRVATLPPRVSCCDFVVLPLEHVRVATPQQFQSMLEFETCERVDFVVNVRCCKNSVRLTTIVEMLNMLFTAFAVRGCMG